MEVEARVEGLRPFLIHGEQYTVVYYSHVDGSETIHQTQLASADLPAGLTIGDRIILYSVVGVIAEIRVINDQSSG